MFFYFIFIIAAFKGSSFYCAAIVLFRGFLQSLTSEIASAKIRRFSLISKKNLTLHSDTETYHT